MCRYNPENSGATVTGIVRVTQYSEEQLTEVVAKAGPVAVAIEADLLFMFYKFGVHYNPLCGSKMEDLNHAVSTPTCFYFLASWSTD